MTTASRTATAAASTAATTIKVPPLEYWVSPGVLGFVNGAPANPSLRGMVRNELNIASPKDMTLTTANWTKFLNDKFTDSKPYLEKLKPYFDANKSIPRLYTSSGEEATVQREVPRAQQAQAPAVRANDDGTYTLPGIRITARERGTATFESTFIWSGNVNVPGDVVRAGADAIKAWLWENRERLAITDPEHPQPGQVLEEATENYLYDNWAPTEYTAEETTLPNAVVAEAVRQTNA